jgi:transcription antitermination factor NusG
MPADSFSEPNSPRWYALRVRPRFEKAAAEIMRRLGVEEFLPLYSSRRRWSDRIQRVDLPLFPGYVFCRLDLAAPGPRVVAQPGVVGFVVFDGGPAEIPEEQLDAVRKLLDSQRRLMPLALLKVGQQVRVVDGPLAGLTGTLTQIRGRRHVVVNLPLLQRSVAAHLDGDSLLPC